MSAAALDALELALAAEIGRDRVRRDVPLAPLTTFRVGGPADLLVEPHSGSELVAVLTAAREHALPVTLLGGGSNVLVGDRGIRGLVVRPRAGAAATEGPGRVRADAALTLNGLVRWTIGRGFAGLEAWAGTPGTVGGAVYGNAHWAGRQISEMVESVRLWDAAAGVADVPGTEMGFAYDASRLQHTGEIVLSVLFRVTAGEVAALRAIARESLAYRKRTQPLDTPSAGCIFQNPAADDGVPPGIPRSAGALVDRAGLKGLRIGGAVVSPTHGNFIVNAGTGTAADILALVEQCRQAVRARFGVELRNEIVCLGDFGGVAGRPSDTRDS
jgi:UDP-N-acetylmuramate dehydrogenase